MTEQKQELSDYYSNEEVLQRKKELRKQIMEGNCKIWVFNSYKGLNWDNSQSKGFILAFIYKNEIMTLNPEYLKNLGWDTHYKKSYAESYLFYDGVLGMSRTFNIVYNLSSWLFKEIEDKEEKQLFEFLQRTPKEDKGYILTNH